MKKVTTKIIHIPYLEFSGDETLSIMISPIEMTIDSIIEIRCENLKKTVYDLDDKYLDTWMCPYGTWNLNHNTNDTCTLFLIKAQHETQLKCDLQRYDRSRTDNILKKDLSNDYDTIRITSDYVEISDYKKYAESFDHFINHTYQYFALGSCSNQYGNRYNHWGYKGKLNFLKIERKNSLYKHYLPCVRIYNLVDDNNTIIQENLLDWGFFESVNQDYYIADSNSIPTHTGDSLNEDYSNLLDINGNVINI